MLQLLSLDRMEMLDEPMHKDSAAYAGTKSASDGSNLLRRCELETDGLADNKPEQRVRVSVNSMGVQVQ